MAEFIHSLAGEEAVSLDSHGHAASLDSHGHTPSPKLNLQKDGTLSFQVYSGDLNSEHLNSVFPLFRCPLIVRYSRHDLNSELKVCYSSHDLNGKLKVCYSSYRINDSS